MFTYAPFFASPWCVVLGRAFALVALAKRLLHAIGGPRRVVEVAVRSHFAEIPRWGQAQVLLPQLPFRGAKVARTGWANVQPFRATHRVILGRAESQVVVFAHFVVCLPRCLLSELGDLALIGLRLPVLLCSCLALFGPLVAAVRGAPEHEWPVA